MFANFQTIDQDKLASINNSSPNPKPIKFKISGHTIPKYPDVCLKKIGVNPSFLKGLFKDFRFSLK
ncbi:hypothetical protein BpHYR1_036952 [Brachionus plicatilis]|uniref:Uncharacterized protein n=1 Tax=Brachionus plicatilis TaxID=10195 RepID=A0A3M7S8X1_BRAPC|nr:hypothetical protein BpHYR1_036952 [Brachionus plicatilis]